MTGSTATPPLTPPPAAEPNPTPPNPNPSLISDTKTPEQIAAEAAAQTPEALAAAETARLAALTPEQRQAETDATARAEAMKAPVTAEAIKLPTGVTLAENGLDPLLGVINNAELTPAERAQSLVDMHLEALNAASEAGSKAWNDLQTQWQEEVKADPVIGKEHLPASIATMGKLVEQFGDQATRDAFDLTGAGNNPAILRFLVKMGAKLTEGGPVSGSPAAEAGSAAKLLFPSMKE